MRCRKIELRYANPCNWNSDHQTSQWPSNSNIKHLASIGSHPVHADNRSHRANWADDWKWYEVRIARRNAITEGG